MQHWRDSSFRSCPYGRWSCRRTRSCPLLVGREASIKAIESAVNDYGKRICLVTQREPELEKPDPADLYAVGVVGRVLQYMRLPEGPIKVLFEGLYRISWRPLTPEDQETRSGRMPSQRSWSRRCPSCAMTARKPKRWYGPQRKSSRNTPIPTQKTHSGDPFRRLRPARSRTARRHHPAPAQNRIPQKTGSAGAGRSRTAP